MPARTSARHRPDPATLNTDERFRSRREVLRRLPESVRLTGRGYERLLVSRAVNSLHNRNFGRRRYIRRIRLGYRIIQYMTRLGRPTAELVLSDEEHQTLTRWARRRKSSQAVALRSRIVLACAQGLTNKQVAAQEHVSQPTVGKWRSRFVEARCDGRGRRTAPGPASHDYR